VAKPLQSGPLNRHKIDEMRLVHFQLPLFHGGNSSRFLFPASPKTWGFFLLHIYINVAEVCGGEFVVEFVAVEWIFGHGGVED